MKIPEGIIDTKKIFKEAVKQMTLRDLITFNRITQKEIDKRLGLK